MRRPPVPPRNDVASEITAMIYGIHHVALATFDIAATADFYRIAFDFEVAKKSAWTADNDRIRDTIGVEGTAAKLWMLKGPNLFLELFEYLTPRGRRHDRHLADPGYSHICFSVEDIDAEQARLSSAGMTFRNRAPGGRLDTTRAIYGRDPDGNIIELLEHRRHAEHPYHAALLWPKAG
jgi:catechol 2,3-dioxygenase-like lactoylglutathione lyase family enzyme